MTVYNHYRDYPMSQWIWPNFSPREMASKREGELLIHPDSMDKLQALRTALGVPLVITSAYRSAAHNKAVGGAKNSQHRLGRAFDVMMANHDPAAFEKAARKAGFTGFGYYPKQGFMHIDTGPARTWGTPFPRNEAALAPDVSAPREGISSTDGKAAAGIGGAGAVAVALDHLPVAGGIIGQLAPVAQIIAVCAAVALLGYIIWRRRA